MSIRQLPEHVVDKIKSSVVITSLNNVILGLLKNALDVDATKVNVYIDYTRGNCTVEDNGLGIPPDEFQLEGGLGKLHHTSRFPPTPHTHGKHGDFLASLAALSLLSVVSHHHRHVSHNSIAAHNGKVLTRHLPCPPEQRFHTFDHGTRVAVRDLFGSMPVRVKHRATLSSERSNLDREWHRLTTDIVALLLAWPNQVILVIRDSTGQRVLRLKPPETGAILDRTSRLLTQASLIDSSDAADSWVPISAASGPVSINGSISLDPVATKRCQFLSLGIQPIRNDYGTNVLYEEVNKAFGRSSFGVVEVDGEDHLRDAHTVLKSRKGIELWPTFYLRIQLATAYSVDVDEALDAQQQDITAISDLLQAVCYGFLKKHHMRPRKVKMLAGDSVFSTSTTLSQLRQVSNRPSVSSSQSVNSSRSAFKVRNPTRSGSPFDGWHTVKVGHASAQPVWKIDGSSLIDGAQNNSTTRLVGKGGRLLRKPFDISPLESENGSDSREARGSVGIAGTTSTLSTDPTPPFEAPVKNERCTELPKQMTHKRSILEKRPKMPPSPWLQGVLNSWNNPVFEIAQSSVPRAYKDATATSSDLATGVAHRCGGEDETVMFESASASLNGRVSKAMLLRAEVISQVDRKFILVKLPLATTESGRETSTLVMLDQHAVDERCRLEDLMAAYFEHKSGTGSLQPVIEGLERPLIFEVSEQELQLIQKYQDHFGSWGIAYQVQAGAGTTRIQERETKVKVIGLPPSIIERCRNEPRVLVDLIRKEVWRLHEDGGPSRRLNAGSVSGNGTTNFYGCPQGILELLHSRSCRSAIMFNDVLSKEDCKKLVGRLALCALPFQCAHGRPSMAPLVDLGSGSRVGEWQEGESGQSNVWKRWLES